jgi:hypothetical protein
VIDWNAIEPLGAEESAERLTGLLEEIATQLDAQQQIRELLLELLARQLGGPIDAETFTKIQEGIGTLFGLGEDPGLLFMWLIMGETRERVEALARKSPPSTERLLREVFAVHGSQLAEAYGKWRELPEALDWVNRAVSYDVLSDRYKIELAFKKFSGETFALTCDADTLLFLTTYLVRSLNLITTANPFIAERVNEFREAGATFWETLDLAREAAQAADRMDGDTRDEGQRQ